MQQNPTLAGHISHSTEQAVTQVARAGLFNMHALHLYPPALAFCLIYQPCSALTMVLPSAAGLPEINTPPACKASVLSPAVSLPPEIAAPAWRMRRPGGAVTPAMKPTTG